MEFNGTGALQTLTFSSTTPDGGGSVIDEVWIYKKQVINEPLVKFAKAPLPGCFEGIENMCSLRTGIAVFQCHDTNLTLTLFKSNSKEVWNSGLANRIGLDSSTRVSVQHTSSCALYSQVDWIEVFTFTNEFWNFTMVRSPSDTNYLRYNISNEIFDASIDNENRLNDQKILSSFVPMSTHGSGTFKVLSEDTTNNLFPAYAIGIIVAVVCLILIGSIAFIAIRRRTRSIGYESPNEQDLDIHINENLVLLRELNSGGFGVVYMGLYKGQTVAVKKMKFGDKNDKMIDQARMFVDEAETMLEMKHEKVAELIDIDINSMSLVMEFMEIGSLLSYIAKNPKMDWNIRYQIMLDMVEGMAFLHAKNFADGTPKKRVYHQDLKSGNILLTVKNGMLRAKISDFGLASLLF